MSVNPNQFDTWFKEKKITNKYAAYYGSRNHIKSIIKTSFIRKFLGLFFKLLIKAAFSIDLKDTQCGFKVFNKSYAYKIFKNLQSHRFAFDVELTLLLKNSNILIKELPLMWNHKDGSKLNIFLDIPKMFLDILFIKIKEKKK